MMQIVKRYRAFLIVAAIDLGLLAAAPHIGFPSVRIALDSLVEMLIVIPPIFVLLGLFDVWVERETMMRLMGERSGWLGVTIAFALGSFAAGPLYAAFPVAGALMKKGSKFSNILIFIGAWSTTKIPLLMFEASSMGWRFMAMRFALNLPVIALIAHVTEKMTSHEERALIYARGFSL